MRATPKRSIVNKVAARTAQAQERIDRRTFPPGTYVGNYTDAEGNILHGKHPWASKPHSNPAAVLEQLEVAIFRLHVNCFPRIEYVNSETTLRHIHSVLPAPEGAEE